MFYFYFFTSLVLTAGITVLVRKAAISLNILDQIDEGRSRTQDSSSANSAVRWMAIF